MQIFGQEVDNTIWNYTPAQIAHAEEISKTEGFSGWISLDYELESKNFEDKPRKPGPFMMCFRVGDALHAHMTWEDGTHKDYVSS